jgi:hypothetical protein
VYLTSSNLIYFLASLRSCSYSRYVTGDQNGTSVASGNASSIDIYTFTIIKTASATYTVLGAQTKFA